MDSKDFNRLKVEASAYLKQHAKNPVHWWPYGPEALLQAKEENKPIFLSIGYSTCHWCHVMAHESFEDQTTADFLNQHFINIKVDREEHPDLDHYFQMACMAMNGRGGWPLSVFTTPDLKPYFIGTYFPRERQGEMPSFMEVIKGLSAAYEKEGDKISQDAQQIHEMAIKPPRVENKAQYEGHFPSAAAIIDAIKNYADQEHGGYGKAPKFPQFPFYEWAVEQILEGVVPQELGQHIVTSVEKMLMGGINDHARGGIHRYSTDEHWSVPHFEKMLYDQAGLLKLLAKLSVIYPAPIVYDTIILTLQYLRVEMLSDEGHFFAAQDADSEGMEGLFFTFTKDEFIDAVVDFEEKLTDSMDDILKWFGITEQGNFEKNLNVIRLQKEFKEEYYQPQNWNTIRSVRQAILEQRKMRIPPMTDNKGIASWNFQLISALCDVIQYCNIESIVQGASQLLKQCSGPILKTFMRIDETTQKTRILQSTTTEGLPLFENYVFFSEAQLRLSEISGDQSAFQNGINALKHIHKEFFDGEHLYSRAKDFEESELHPNLITALFDQSHKSATATYISLLRKWSLVDTEVHENLIAMGNFLETMAQLTLQNPLAQGEALRALTYPDLAYRKLEVPREWTAQAQYQQFYPFFSHRFCLCYHDRADKKWQICTANACELQGEGLEEFVKVFAPPEEEQK